MQDIVKRNITDHAHALEKKEYSSEELTLAYLRQIEERDGELCAFITVTKEEALNAARLSDKRRANGETLGALDGIPIAIKDNICTRGIKTTCASRMLENYLPPYNATAVNRLSERGAVLIGKLNMDEFAMGSTTESSYFGAVKNPVDTTRTPGGSSGGSAAAVAAFMCAGALGSDTGGSVRQPASFCGTVGMKPTYGRVSRYGLVAFASSFDCIGTLTRSVSDNALLLGAIAGADKLDATCADKDTEDFTLELGKTQKGLRIALISELLGEKILPDVRKAVYNAASAFEEIGAKVCEVSIPELCDAVAAYYIISCAEASSNLARYDGIRYGASHNALTPEELYKKVRTECFGYEVKRRIMLGTYVLSAGYYDKHYARAKQLCAKLKDSFSRIFEKYDLILCPTAPSSAYRLSEKRSDSTKLWADDLCTVPASVTGLPALSVPYGNDGGGLPIGVQLIGKEFSESLLYSAAYALINRRSYPNDK